METITVKRRAALERFSLADDAWHKAVTEAFGKDAGQVRYTPAGRGLPGSALREAFDARENARREWEALR